LVTVRIRNVQSVEDATIVVDGFTTITGTNNSGKTAVMRAIKGVFTNPPAISLLRHGCAYFTVSIEFGDGTTVVWEKGWEKPDQKGKTINRYCVNGVTIEGVGSGVPPEVEALGVRSISAASDTVWPQIADQFDGTLFLVNRPGSSMAEALSDVEKVGKLSSALKLSERDKRSCESELKVRRKDLSMRKTELSKYDGLDNVGILVKALSVLRGSLDSDLSHIRELESQSSRYESAKSRLSYYSGFDPELIPDPSRLLRVHKGVEKVRDYHSRYNQAMSALHQLSGFSDVELPDDLQLRGLKDKLGSLGSLLGRYNSGVSAVSRYDTFSVELPESESLVLSSENLRRVTDFESRLTSARKKVSELSSEESVTLSDLRDRESEVSDLIGINGFCPTCNAVCDPDGSHLAVHPDA
jgi:DNA repair ATPase RecN